MSGRKSLFIFLMGLAWKCRYSMPLLLGGSAAVLGRTWMFQIRLRTAHQLRATELAYYNDDEADSSSSESNWDSTESTESWETIVEEVSYG